MNWNGFDYEKIKERFGYNCRHSWNPEAEPKRKPMRCRVMYHPDRDLYSIVLDDEQAFIPSGTFELMLLEVDIEIKEIPANIEKCIEYLAEVEDRGKFCHNIEYTEVIQTTEIVKYHEKSFFNRPGGGVTYGL